MFKEIMNVNVLFKNYVFSRELRWKDIYEYKLLTPTHETSAEGEMCANFKKYI